MSSVLFSRDWYRISGLKPQLNRHVEVHVHQYRGKRSYVLQNHSTGQFKRLTPQGYLLVGLLDGCRTLDQVWQLLNQRLGEELPTHEEMLHLVVDLYRGNIIKMDLPGDVSENLRFGQEQRQKKLLGKLRSPLSIQVPMIDPTRFLDLTEKYIKPIFSWPFACLWLVMICFLAISAAQNWSALTSNLSDQILAADNLLLLWVVYPIIKLLHEFAHAYTVRRFGGQVHEIGIMFLVFFPMPYVDASASTAFSNKYQRMLVDAAGMLVELLIAAVAMVVWLNAEEGLAKSFSYNVLFIAGVSTLLFNGNPLLRFDGYYLLSDWLEIPNLSQKSNKFWGYASKRILFNIKDAASPADSKSEIFIFLLYGAASFFYRLFISISIALFVATQYFFIGVVLAVWSIITVWLWPVGKLIWKTAFDPEIKLKGRKPLLVILSIGSFLYALLFVLAVPRTTTVEGVVIAKEDSRVLVQENCFFEQWMVTAKQQVQVDDTVASCTNEELTSALAVNRWQLKEAQAKLLEQYSDPVQVNILKEEISFLLNSIEAFELRISRLEILSNIDGSVWLMNSLDIEGQWLRKGQVLGYVVDDDTMSITAMLPAYMVKEVQSQTQRVELMFSHQLGTALPAQQWNIFPSTSSTIASPILSESGGGTIKLDPSQEGKTLEPYFYVDIKLHPTTKLFVNERVYVRFVQYPEAIGFRILRSVRRTFLSYFNL